MLTIKIWKSFLCISLSHSFNEAIVIPTSNHDFHTKATPIDSYLNEHGLDIESLVGSIIDTFIIHIFKLFGYSNDV